MAFAKRKTNGGVTRHAVSRLKEQYEFKGPDREARRLLRACRKAAGKIGRIVISAKALVDHGISEKDMKRWNIPDGKIEAVIVDNTVISVFDAGDPRA